MPETEDAAYARDAYRKFGEYVWADCAVTCSAEYLLPKLLPELRRIQEGLAGAKMRLFDLGCGNGSVSNVIARHGWEVTGVDYSRAGIARAKSGFPHLDLHVGSAYDDLAGAYGTFPVVTSLEVISHLYSPRLFASTVFSLCDPGGTAMISTPYHGYWKNLALSLTGRMDSHFHALWDHGFIKFWSTSTLHALLTEAGFVDIRFKRVGRIPALAKAMIAIAKRPNAT